ncbi:unnamed protein product, partial [Hymenolepis diminuta]
MPGDKNFRHRVSRALEYWSGFTFSQNSLKGKIPVQAFPVSKMNLTIHKTGPSTTEDLNKEGVDGKQSDKLISAQRNSIEDI